MNKTSLLVRHCQLAVFLFVFFQIVFLPKLAVTQIEQNLVQRFKDEAPDAWVEYEKKKRELENIGAFSFESDSQMRRRSGLQPYTISSVKRRGSSHELYFQTDYMRGIATVFGRNPQYFFELERPAEGDKWVVIKCVKLDSDSNVTARTEGYQGVELSNHWAKFPMGSFKIPWFDYDLQINRAEWIEYDGKSCVEMAMEFHEDKRPIYLGEATDGPLDRSKLIHKEVTHKCIAVFCPDEYWLLRKIDGYFEGSPLREREPYSFSEEFDFHVDGHPLTTSRVQEFWNDDIKQMVKSRVFSAVYNTKSHPAKDFTLSAFGFPEPDWYIPPRPWWLYASLTGMALLLVGAVLLRYGRQVWNRN